MPAQPITYADAIDTIFGMVNAAWQSAVGIVGYAPQIRWQGQEQPAKPPVDKIWARVSQQIVTDNQAALAGGNGKRLYHAKGLLYIQLFCPRNAGDLTIARIFAQYVREVFRTESPDGNIWFTNQRIVELAPTPLAYPINVSCNFEYDNLNGQVNVNPIVLALQRGGKHYPVEAFDGVRTQFTFVGLPASNNDYVITINGLIYDNLPQAGQVVTFPFAPNPANVPPDSAFAIY